MLGDTTHICAQSDKSSCLFNVQECPRTIVELAGPMSASIMLQISKRFAVDSDCKHVAQNGELIINCFLRPCMTRHEKRYWPLSRHFILTVVHGSRYLVVLTQRMDRYLLFWSTFYILLEVWILTQK